MKFSKTDLEKNHEIYEILPLKFSTYVTFTYIWMDAYKKRKNIVEL